MSDSSNSDMQSYRRKLAAAFDQPIDPLTDAAAVLVDTGVDPFDIFTAEVLESKDLAPSTYRHFEMIFDEWRSFMADQNRHPACPTPDHVEAYIEWQTAPEDAGGKDNANRTVKEKLRKLNQAYAYWQADPAFPHPAGYNPIHLARDRTPLPVRKDREHRRIPIPELREMVQSVTNLRARAIIVLQLKLGLRAGEVANIRLEDFHVADLEAADHFTECGTHARLEDYEDVIHVPSKHEREGNKSTRPRLLPLDDEVQTLLNHYLFARPDNGEPWLFLSQKSHSKMTNKTPNKIWKGAFHPEYAETDEYRPVTSHYGRHRFTTYWRVEQDVNRQLVKYMRGDRTGAFRNDRGMNAYLHAYYEDIESVYRDHIFALTE